jgi:DNA-binding NarL/FixJ family response regulator
MDKVNILIADDQALIRDGLKTLLELEEDFRVVDTAHNGQEAIKAVHTEKIDVILLDIRMPGMDGIETIKIIKKIRRDIKVIMLTTFNDDEYIMEVLACGANGYLLKDIEVEKLVEAIRDVIQDKIILPSAVAEKLAEGLSRITLKKKSSKEIDDLTEKEREISSMLVQGFSTSQIALSLFISEGTLRNYISNIYRKIGVNDRAKAVLYLKENGIT